MDFKDYSMTGGEFEIIQIENTAHIVKRNKLIALNLPPYEFQQQVVEYFQDLTQAGIPLPALHQNYLENGTLTFISKFQGDNLMIKFDQSKLSEVIQILKKAQLAGLHLDPHPKNFVVSDKVYYVDFCPPYSAKYNEQVLRFYQGEEGELIRKNLECFHPSQLGFHLAADLIKEDDKFMQLLPELFEDLKTAGVVHCDYQDFLTRAREIKEIELERARKNLYLL
jgi:hypothetical protein